MDDSRFFLELGKQIYRIDAMYAEYAKRRKCKNARLLWVLYALDDGTNHSQREIAENWNMPKSSVNAIVSELQEAGYVTLTPIKGQKREMFVRLTPEGEEYAHKKLADLYKIEQKAYENFSPETLGAILSLEDINSALLDAGI